MITFKKLLLLFSTCLLLNACAGFFDKDNTPKPSPLVNLKSEIAIHPIWKVHTNAGAGNKHIKLLPALSSKAVFTADKKGTVSASDKLTGKMLWKINVGDPIIAGPALSENAIFITTKNGFLYTLDQASGNLLWKIKTASEVLASPVASSNKVLVKTIDGRVSAHAIVDGKELWHYQQTEPSLILRGSSAPAIMGNEAIVGFANGNIVKLSLEDGSLKWQTAIAVPQGSFAVQRMIDIDANIWISRGIIYAVTYQGQLVALDLETGHEYWSRKLSSYTGMIGDESHLYVTDADSLFFAFDKNSGKIYWQQKELKYRNITAPVLMGPYLVVGDDEGYLHWVSKVDGHLVARVKVNREGFIAPPTIDNSQLYVVTRNGYLATYSY